MSGIAVLVSRDGGRACALDVLAMLDAIPYRGPDGGFARAFGRAVLGHARMRTTPSDRVERQPLTSPRTGCAIVADIRLDNRPELQAQVAEGSALSATDTQLALRAYEKWGLDAPRHLLGDFAFAIWDPREQRLVCARDSGGQRTLFYRIDQRAFAAASELHQLLQDPRVSLRPDEQRIRSALLPINLSQNDKEQSATYYAGICSLLPGHLLVLEPQRFEVQRFWQMRSPVSIRYRDPRAYVEHFSAIFTRAVADRLQAVGPVGALLSGGLDSSSMVCAAQELYRSGRAVDNGFVTFSTVYPGLECDERPLIEEVQARYGFAAHYLTPDRRREWLQLEPNGFRQRPDLPTNGMATMFDAAQQAGARVLLTGELADSCLRGSPLVFDSLLRQGKLESMPRYLKAFREANGASLSRTLALYVVAPLLPLSLQKQVMSAYVRHHLDRENWRLLPTWMPEALREQLLIANREQMLAREARRTFANDVQHSQHLLFDPPETPTIAAGWPIEIWRPYADRRLHEFLMSIPPEQLFEPVPDDPSCYGGSKQLLRRSMRGLLPESIRTKTQPTHFAASVEQEFNRQWPLHEAAFGPGAHSEVAEHGYVDQRQFWERLQQFRNGRGGSRDFLYTHYVIGLETWLQGLHAPRHEVTTVATRVRIAPSVLVENDEPGAESSVRIESGRAYAITT